MESFRIREKNDINNQIKNIKINISRNDSTIERLRSQEKSDFNINQIQKLHEKNKSYNTELEELNQKIIDINNGKYDCNLKKESENAQLQLDKNNVKLQKKNEEKENKKKKEKIYMQKFYDMNRNRGPNDLSESQIRYETKRFFKLCDSIPEYIIRNLESMPSNKGYIWRDLWCFGKLPEEPGKPLLMFEKCNNNILRIYEIDKTSRKIYEKQGTGRKVLVSTEERKPIPGSKIFF